MNKTRVEFTEAQRLAVLWRLEQGDCIAQVFADTEGLETLSPNAEARAGELAAELSAQGFVDVRFDALDREIMREAISGSTYLAAHDPENDTRNTLQRLGVARRVLTGARDRIAAAFALEPRDIDLPAC